MIQNGHSLKLENGNMIPQQTDGHLPTRPQNDHCQGNHVLPMVHQLLIDMPVSINMDVASRNHRIQSTHGATRHDW